MIRNTLGTLRALEDLWSESSSNVELLSAITPHISNILVNNNQVVFLDMMKYVTAVLSTLYEELSRDNVLQFTERFIQAAHLTVEKYFDNEDFNQNRYLDCVAALLSMWIDTTSQHKLVWRKIFIYLRGSDSHMLNTILQSTCISKDVIRKILKSIKHLQSTETFVRYVICGRRCKTTEFQTFALSYKPSDDVFRDWLTKRNINGITIAEFINVAKIDEVLLETLTEPDYTLPSRDESKVCDNKDSKPEATLDLENLFFIDRGSADEPPAKRKSSRHSEEVVPTLRKSMGTSQTIGGIILNDTLSDDLKDLDAAIKEVNKNVLQENRVAPDSDQKITNDNNVNSCSPVQDIQKPTSPLKIMNERKLRGRPRKQDKVLVIAPKSPVAAKPGQGGLTEEKLSSLPNSRRRQISECSEISVDSVASRTRSRKKPVVDLDAIKENSPANIKPQKKENNKKAITADLKNPDVRDESEQRPATRTRSRRARS